MTKFSYSLGNPYVYTGEWRRMSLPPMLVGETLGEILHASQFAREIVSAVGNKTPSKEDPKTPLSQRPSKKINLENTQLKSRRKKEKQTKQLKWYYLQYVFFHHTPCIFY